MRKRSSIIEVDRHADPLDYIGAVVRIPPSLVKPMPGQPRMHFDAPALRRLRESIAAVGQQQPATVVPWEDGTFRLRDGERRWRSCRELGIPLVALVVEPCDAEEEFELSTVANLNRESHSPLEKALAMKRLREGPLRRSVEQIARTFGVSDAVVRNHLLVVSALPKKVLELLDPNLQGDRHNTLPMSCAVRLTSLRDYPAEQLRIATRIAREKLGVSAGIRLIDRAADVRAVASGRGREQKPSDRLRGLSTGLRRLRPLVEHFSHLDQEQIEELFEWSPGDRRDQLMADLLDAQELIGELRQKFAAAERAGTRRGLKRGAA